MTLLKHIKTLKSSKIKNHIAEHIKQFEQISSTKDIFSELCFCLLTANFNAVGGIKIQKAMHDVFLDLSEQELASKLKELGHRFPNARAKYIAEAQEKADALKNALENLEEKELREWLVKNIKGIGYKEASHFLRNIGYKNLAIIDFHIIDLLAREGLIKRPKTITPKNYLEIEALLKKIAQKANLNLAELDFYLWFIETGKVLK